MNCAICGRPASIIYSLDPELSTTYWLCPDCNAASGFCHTCAHAQKCEFETNPSPTPKQITKSIRQGNMMMQTMIRNPERIREFCHSCPCFQEEICCKEYSHCKNWEFCQKRVN